MKKFDFRCPGSCIDLHKGLSCDRGHNSNPYKTNGKWRIPTSDVRDLASICCSIDDSASNWWRPGASMSGNSCRGENMRSCRFGNNRVGAAAWK